MRSIPHIIALITITLFATLGIVPIATIAFPDLVKAITDIAALAAAAAIPCIVLAVLFITVRNIVKGS